MHLQAEVLERVRTLLLDVVHPLMVVLDTDYRICFWNGSCAHYGLGRPAVGQDLRELLPEMHGIPLAADFELPFVETPLGGSMDLRILSLAGDRFLLLITDTTETRDWRQRVQQQSNEIQLLQQRQEKLLRRLEQADRLKSRFIASMSHEFRTPLAAIQGQLELIRGQDPRNASSLNVIEANSAHLMTLVDNILDQACIEQGTLALQFQPTDIRELGRGLYSMFSPLAEKKGLTLDLQVKVDGIPKLCLDPMRLRQVLVNLLGNAIKYTRQGGVELGFDWRSDQLQAWVRDSGPGISTQARVSIFEAFHQEAGASEGVGLGLAISQGLVKLMGGSLELASAPETGSIFKLRIPAQAAGEDHVGQSNAGILLVDDAADLRGLIALLLKKDGFEVREAEDQRELSVHMAGEAFDAVVLDLQLGDEDGCELARGLRDQGYEGVLLMLSASSDPKDMQRAKSAGCDDYLLKTAGAKAVGERLRALLKSAPASSGGRTI